MASFTQVTKRRRAIRRRNRGADRKRRQAKRSTLSYEELFAGCGEPGQPAPAVATKAAPGKG